MYPDGRLFVFDWESAEAETIPLYDVIDFHFKLLLLSSFAGSPGHVARSIFEACGRWESRVDQALVPYLFLTYLVDFALGRLATAAWLGSRADNAELRFVAELVEQQGQWLI